MKQLLIYTACDKKYEMFIPLFCLSHCIYNKNIDIEIAIEKTLDDNVEQCLNIIRKYFPEVNIHINYNSFKVVGYSAIVNGIKCIKNSVRFILKPYTRAEYVYITDIDIICCEDIADTHIADMIQYNSPFSNIVRKNTKRMTGLHFTKYDAYYPLDINYIKYVNTYNKNDEELLYDIVKKNNNIDLSRTYRPVHGIHMSLNRPTVAGTADLPGWGAQNFITQWKHISSTDCYKEMQQLFNKKLSELILLLNTYYEKG